MVDWTIMRSASGLGATPFLATWEGDLTDPTAGSAAAIGHPQLHAARRRGTHYGRRAPRPSDCGILAATRTGLAGARSLAPRFGR